MRVRLRRALRRVATGWRLGLALLLLAGVFFSTVRAVDTASSGAERRRLEDRAHLADAFASSAGRWLQDGADDATALALAVAGTGPVAARRAIDDYLATEASFGRAVVLLDPTRRVVATSSNRTSVLGLTDPHCVLDDPAVTAAHETALDTLVELASREGGPFVSALGHAPGACGRLTVLAAARAAGNVLLVEGDLRDVQARLAAANAFEDGTRAFFVDPAGRAVLPDGPPGPSPDRIRPAIGSTEPIRYAVGEAEVVAAGHGTGHGWTLVVEQDAAIFDVERLARPSTVVASALTLTFAVVFALIALFEVRRQRAARRADAARHDMLAIAGHELRTPLTILRGFTDTLAARWEDLDDERRQALTEKLAVQARRLGRVLERVLLAAGIRQQTHVRAVPSPVEVGTVVATVIERFADEAPLHDLEADVPEDLPKVRADARSLEQVLEQLVDNAIKYSPSGGTVRVWAEVARRSVRIVVDDEGIGLPEGRRDLFAPFVQGEDVDSRVHGEGGVGLGLFVVDSLIRELGGSVSASTRPSGGSRFEVVLKRARERRSDRDAA